MGTYSEIDGALALALVMMRISEQTLNSQLCFFQVLRNHIL